jgi:aspartyl-tRNA synthetase
MLKIFRKLYGRTSKHLNEFVSLDLEMVIKFHYYELIDVMNSLFLHIFEGIEKKFSEELKIISQQYPFKPIEFNKENLIITYKEALSLLSISENKVINDIASVEQILLGKIIKEKYKTDCFFLEKYPSEFIPFTCMKSEDGKTSNSFDFFIRGIEVASGSQRIHDPDVLNQSIKDQKNSSSSFEDYVENFNYGSFPHAGSSIGLERFLMSYLEIQNIRNVSMFPRDSDRLTP